MHGASAWNRIKAGMVARFRQVVSDMLTLNEIEGEMAAANARVNELVAMQAEMLLKAAKVRSSCRYWNSAKCRVG